MEAIITLLSLVPIKFIDCGKEWYSGYYSEPPPAINICIQKDRQAMKKTIIHELGHYFRFNYLTEEEKNNWKILFENSYTDDFIYWYAMNNYEEDFAETFSSIYYPVHYIDTGLLRLKVYYINKLINKYLTKD